MKIKTDFVTNSSSDVRNQNVPVITQPVNPPEEPEGDNKKL